MRGVVPISHPLLALEEVRGTGTLGELADASYVLARPDDSMFDLFRSMGRHNAERALVVDKEGVPKPEDIKGIVSKRRIADAVLGNFSS